MKLENNLVQSRDEDDGNVTEEDLTFSNNYERSSFSIDTEIGYKKKYTIIVVKIVMKF